MKKVTRAIVFICAVALCVSTALTGCIKKTQTPEEVVKSYFAAFKTNDTAAMEKLIIPMDSSSSSSSTSSSADSDAMFKALYAKVEGQIEEKAKISGDTASVKVKITAPDMKKIMSNEISKAFSQAFTNAFSGSSASSEDTDAQMTKNVTSDLSQADVALTTTEMNIQLTKKNGKWMIQSSQNFADAMTGGLYSVGQSLSGSSSSEG